MQLRVGGYRFTSDTVAVSTAKETIWDDLNRPVAFRVTFTCQGRLEGDTQGQITAACALLEAALALPGQDVVMSQTDGSVAFAMRNVTSLSGVRISGPNYPSGEGAEYATYRTFSFTATADYPTGLGSLLVSFAETVSFSGGGPLKAFLEPVNGPPIRQTIKVATPYRAVQQGQASGLKTWPVPPAPNWPNSLMQNQDISYSSPRRELRGITFAVSWAYQFGSVTPLNGRPKVLIAGGGG